MAWRIENAIVHGEIDNTSPGRTVGRLWLIHQEHPLELDLVGDCWRDLAGAVLTFHNPHPDYSLEAPGLASPQSGVVGDMTASRKGKVYHTDLDEEGFTWQNHLSLEWFDVVNGRVLVETPLFDLQLSERHWEQSGEEEERQKCANLEAMRGFIHVFLQRGANLDLWTEENADEFAWEKRFRESDRLTEAFQELVEKYADDPASQQKLSYAMGWDRMLGEEQEEEDLEFDADAAENLDEEDADETDEDWAEMDSWEDFLEEEFGDYVVHPLQLKAHDVATAAIDLFGDRIESNGPESRLCAQLMQIAAKLAGALNFSGESFEQEPGYILALLKRCLHWQNDAISTCHELISKCKDPEQEQALLAIRESIFAVRDQITEMRREYKQN
jgi:hypothetical protein